MESNNSDNLKAMIAMSGGVDSSVCAYLYKEAGCDIAGASLCLCTHPGNADAEAVCRKLAIPYYEFDYRDMFRDKVMQNFADTYIEGGTPNPCIVCNRTMKFGVLLSEAEKAGYDLLVTGHYARIEFDEKNGRYLLKKACDERKDQSYVLYNLTQEQLSKVRFPLGVYSKDEIREIAAKAELGVAAKKDSQDICFLPNGGYADFIENFMNKRFPEGDFVDREGNVYGTHKGIIRYTIGQRKGLGLALKEPAYVISKDMENNKVILGPDSALYSDTLIAGDVNWIAFDAPKSEIRCAARVRYNQKETPATVIPLDDGRVKVIFDAPVRGITRGQSAVFYRDDICLGGGIIE